MLSSLFFLSAMHCFPFVYALLEEISCRKQTRALSFLFLHPAYLLLISCFSLLPLPLYFVPNHFICRQQPYTAKAFRTTMLFASRFTTIYRHPAPFFPLVFLHLFPLCLNIRFLPDTTGMLPFLIKQGTSFYQRCPCLCFAFFFPTHPDICSTSDCRVSFDCFYPLLPTISFPITTASYAVCKG